MDAVDSQAVQSWLDGIERPGAARKAWALIRAMLRRARREGITSTDVTALLIDLPQVPHYEAPVLDTNGVRALLRGCWGWNLEAWVIVSVSLGLRPEEAMGLEWQDMNLRSGIVRIERGIQWINGHEAIVPPKTTLSRRDLILPAYARKRLKQLKQHQRGRLTGTLTPPQVARRYKTWCQIHKLPYVPPESLRHTWATLALKSGVDISVVSRCLGHASIETTAAHYLHPDLSVITEAQRKFNALITG
ncbi:MAG: site-specific integrase [Bifidobacteriaceae bacterium]|jgi:integrase|nr:site-specific integrase [Bifidobacteriaceae bacterium]